MFTSWAKKLLPNAFTSTKAKNDPGPEEPVAETGRPTYDKTPHQSPHAARKDGSKEGPEPEKEPT